MSLTFPHVSSTRFTRKRLLVASIFCIVGFGIFFVIYDGVKENGDLARLDSPVLNFVVAHRSHTLTILMQTITTLMAPATLAAVILIGACLWGWRQKQWWRPGLLVGAMALALGTSTLIKNITERSRPPSADMIPPFEIDYSFPSGHTLGVAVCLLVLGYLIYSRRPSKRRLFLWIIAIIAGVSLVAFSRLYLGYHWITDVSASAGLALVILGIVVAIDGYAPRHAPTKAV